MSINPISRRPTINSATLHKADKSPESALRNFEMALEIRGSLARKDPDNSDWQIALAREYMSIADVVKTVDTTRAIENYRNALFMRKQLAEKNPWNLDWQLNVVATHNKLADTLRKIRQFDDALTEFSAALAIQESLARIIR